MNNKSARVKRKPLDSPAIALSWLQEGIAPIPLRPSSKIPAKGLKAWPKLRVTPETIPQFFEPGQNIGGLWGEPSGWVVDIDLDWDEASSVAPHLLPPTFVYGRTGRPASHYLYRCKGAETVKLRCGNDAVIVEVRSTGSQSVLPPSIHPEGGRYYIDEDVPIATLSRRDLERHVREVAAAALLIRKYPQEGGRHDYVHAITGALLWAHWTEERVERFVLALLRVVVDDDPEQRRRTIKNTLEHFRSGDRVQGFATLSQFLEGREVQSLRKWLTDTRFEEPPPQDIVEGPSRIPRFDPRWLEVPGLVGAVAKWAGRGSYLKNPAFDLAAALMSVAIASSNKYRVDSWNTPLQPYFLLLAPTSWGKGASLNAPYKFAKQIGLGDYVYQGFQSYYAMLDRLSEPPSIACWIWDEVARHLRSAQSPSSPDHATITHMLNLYGRGLDSLPAMPGRRNSIPPLDRPFLLLMAGAQPEPLVAAIGRESSETGFNNRLILWDCGEKPPETNKERSDVFPIELKRQALILKSHEPRGDLTNIRFDEEATVTFLEEFDRVARAKGYEDPEHSLWGRANQNALILAGIAAVGINPAAPVITRSLAEWAVEIVTWSVQCWSARLGETSSRSRREGQSKRIELQIRRAKLYSAKGAKHQEALKGGKMPRSILMRLNRDLNKRELDEILDVLIEANLIGMSEDENGLVLFWPKQ